MSVVGGHVERRQLVLAGCVHVDAALDQQAHHLGVAVLRGDVQRAQPFLSDTSHVRQQGLF